MRKLSLFVIFLLIVPISVLHATGTHWVSSCTSGCATWTSCVGASPLNGTSACSLSTANNNVVAGDTVYMRGGTYITSGTAGAFTFSTNGTDVNNMISFIGYNGEEVIVYGIDGDTGYNCKGLNFSGRSYIKIAGLTFTHLANWGFITGSDHIEIANNIFKDQRNPYSEKLFWSGVALADDPTGVVLTHEEHTSPLYTGYLLRNLDDKSGCIIGSTGTDSTHKQCPSIPWVHLRNGYTNQWHVGDHFEIRASRELYGYGGLYVYSSTTHSWIHGNTFHNYGGFTWHDEGVALQVGSETDSGHTDISDHNTIEDNHLYNSGHHIIGINAGKYDVVRNNYIHSEAWYTEPDSTMWAPGTPPTNDHGCMYHANGKCGYRVASSNADEGYGGYALWERNRIAYGAKWGPNMNTGNSGSGTSLATGENIYRYNLHYDNSLYGIRVTSSYQGAKNHNRIYNNTFWKEGYGTPDEEINYDPSLPTTYRTGFNFPDATGCTPNPDGPDTVVKNNLFYDHWSVANTSYPTIYPTQDDPNNQCNHNMGGARTNVDPLFVDTTVCTTPPCTDSSKPNLRLKSNSTAINGGQALTTTNGSGSGSDTIVVNDARYFQDGNGVGCSLCLGSSLATLGADWIAVGTTSNTHQIKSVDWSSNTIVITDTTSWSNSDNVWLYKDSAGNVVLYGSASDYGAYEFNKCDINKDGVVNSSDVTAESALLAQKATVDCHLITSEGTTCNTQDLSKLISVVYKSTVCPN